MYGLDEHLKRHHKLPIVKRRALLVEYEGLSLSLPSQMLLPEPYSAPIQELGAAQNAYLSCQPTQQRKSRSESCNYIPTSRLQMQQHENQQHSVKLSRWSTPLAPSYAEHAAQLWRPVKVQTFFQERRYVRYFIVQETEQPQPSLPPLLPLSLEQRDRSQTSQQPRQERAQQDQAESYQQRLACLSYEWDAVEQKDSQAIELIAEEASAKDRTGWFKRTRWDEHLQAYPDWKLLAYAIRLPGDDEPQLQRVVQLVEELVEEAVQGLSTLSLETLRWLRSPKAQEPDVRPFSRM